MLPSVKTEALEGAKASRKVVFHRGAENLYRLDTSGGYYALVKRGNKQFRRSLKTGDFALAKRRLREFQGKASKLAGADALTPSAAARRRKSGAGA